MKALVFDGERRRSATTWRSAPPGPTEVRVRIVVGRPVPLRRQRPRRHDPVARRRRSWATRARAWSKRSARRSRHVKPGDHVVCTRWPTAARASGCITGHPTWCRKSIGNASQPFTVGGEPAWNFAAASFFAEHTVVQRRPGVKIPDEIPLGVGLPDRLWRAHRHRLGAQPHRPRQRPHGGGLRRRRRRAQRDPGAADRRARAASSPSTRCRRRRRRPATSAPPTSSSPGPTSTPSPRCARCSRPRSTTSSARSARAASTSRSSVSATPRCCSRRSTSSTGAAPLVTVGVPAPTAMAELKITAFTQVERTVTGSRAGSHRPHYDIPLIVDAVPAGRHQARRAGLRDVPARGLGDLRPRPPRGQAAARRADRHDCLTVWGLSGMEHRWARSRPRHRRVVGDRRAAAVTFAEAGATVGICARRADRLAGVLERCRASRRPTSRACGPSTSPISTGWPCSRRGPTTSSAVSTCSSTTRASRCAARCRS